MVSHHVVYQLVLFVLIWLVVILHLTGSKSVGISQPAPAKPKRRRSSETKPFAGLTQKPHCAPCEQETAETWPPLLVLLTDGRADASLGSDEPVTDSLRQAAVLCQARVPALVVDTEQGVLRLGLAQALGSICLRLEE